MQKFNRYDNLVSLIFMPEVESDQASKRAFHYHDHISILHIFPVLHRAIRSVKYHQGLYLCIPGRNRLALKPDHANHTNCFEDVQVFFRLKIGMDEDIPWQERYEYLFPPVFPAAHHLDTWKKDLNRFASNA